VRTPGRAAEVAAAARSRRINLREVDADTLVVALDETTTTDTVAAVCAAVGVSVAGDDAAATDAIPLALRRTSEYLAHPAFHRYRSEHQMLRYLRRPRTATALTAP
jgi:glycine dehydrogenase